MLFIFKYKTRMFIVIECSVRCDHPIYSELIPVDVNATDLLDRTLKQPSLSVVKVVDLKDCLINQKFSDAT